MKKLFSFAVLALLATSLAWGQDVTRGLIAYYNFDDGTARNVVGMQNNGFINGRARFISDTPNGEGQALFLDQKQYVNVARNPVQGKKSYTFSLWAKDFGTGDLFTTVGCRETSIRIDNSNCVNYYYYCGWGQSWKFNTNIEFLMSSGWHMITIVFDTGMVYLYADGTLIDSTRHGYDEDGYVLDSDKVQIGGRAERSDLPWTDPFKVDNVRIYGVALTEAEVGQLYDYESN